jgi:hypothetical protein
MDSETHKNFDQGYEAGFTLVFFAPLIGILAAAFYGIGLSFIALHHKNTVQYRCEKISLGAAVDAEKNLNKLLRLNALAQALARRHVMLTALIAMATASGDLPAAKMLRIELRANHQERLQLDRRQKLLLQSATGSLVKWRALARIHLGASGINGPTQPPVHPVGPGPAPVYKASARSALLAVEGLHVVRVPWNLKIQWACGAVLTFEGKSFSAGLRGSA